MSRSIIPPPTPSILDQTVATSVCRFLTIKDLLSASLACHEAHDVLNSADLLERWIINHHDAHFLRLPDEPMTLIRRLERGRMGAEKMWIIHLSEAHWNLVAAPEESVFGQVAQLETVCWLEITAAFRNVLPGTYDVAWRLEMPTAEATNFRCEWSATFRYDEHHPPMTHILYAHEAEPEWALERVEKGWFRVVVGRITVPDDPVPSSVELKMLGGNNHWFQDLKIDCAELTPANVNTALPMWPQVVVEERRWKLYEGMRVLTYESNKKRDNEAGESR